MLYTCLMCSLLYPNPNFPRFKIFVKKCIIQNKDLHKTSCDLKNVLDKTSFIIMIKDRNWKPGISKFQIIHKSLLMTTSDFWFWYLYNKCKYTTEVIKRGLKPYLLPWTPSFHRHWCILCSRLIQPQQHLSSAHEHQNLAVNI